MADLSGYNWNSDPRENLLSPSVPESPDGDASVLGDLALAIPRGVAGAVQDAYGLVDTVAFDALPDWEENPFGESETVVGGLAEGVVNFATGFIPIVGQVGKIGKLGKFGKYAVAGAITDFTVFDGNEQRLSNLLRDYAGLEDPVTEFLAADENDPEIVGRLKNALEGLGVGSVVDLLAMSLRGVKKYRSKVALGVDKETAAKEAAQEIKAEEFQAAYEASQAPPVADIPSAKEVTEEVVEEPVATVIDRDAQLRGLGIDPATITPESIDAGVRKRLADFERAELDPSVNPRTVDAGTLAIAELSEKGLNLRDVRTDQDAALLARAVESTLPPLKSVTMETLQAQAKAYADDVGVDAGKLLLDMGGLGQDIAAGVRRLTAARAVYGTMMDQTVKLINEMRAKGGTDEVRAELVERVKALTTLQRSLHIARSEFGRGLGSLGHTLNAQILSPDLAQRLISETGGPENLDKMLSSLADAYTLSGSGAASAILKQSVGKKAWNVSYEMWIQGILSNPRTAVVSGTSAATATLYRPFEMLMGGGLRALVGGGGGGIHSALSQFRNLKEALPDAWKASKSSWLTEQNRLAGGGLVDVDRRAITAENLGVKDTAYAGIVDTVGRFVRTPGRILSAQDEGFGTLTYRAIVKERLETERLAEYVAKGLPVEQALAAAAADLDRMVIDGMAYSRTALYQEGFAKAKAVNPSGNATTWKIAAKQYADETYDPRLGKLAKEALETVQRDVTLTTPLSQHADNPLVSTAARVQALVEAHPTLKLFAPFIRTPTNIAVWAGQRADISGVAKLAAAKVFPPYAPKLSQAKNRLVQDMLSNDESRKAAAYGRLMTGAAAFAGVTALAENGQITGRGPKDPNLRKILEASGWQPYSVKIGGTWHSYARIDPLATLLGTVADAYEWSKWAPEEDRGEAATLGWGVVVGLANNVTNKTYFTGLMRLTEVLSDPANAAEKTGRSYAASAVPNILASLVPALGDDFLRETRTMSDAMLRKIPGYSDEVAPRRNLLGEPVAWNRVLGDDIGGDFASVFSPVATSAVSDDLIWKELSSLERAFEPPRRMRNGMDLTTFRKRDGQDAYDRWQELSGTTTIRGIKLRDALRKLIKSPDYKKLPAESSWEAQSPRVYEIKNVLETYRAAAFQRVLQEYPELAAEDRRIYLTRRDLKRGVDRRNPLEQR